SWGYSPKLRYQRQKSISQSPFKAQSHSEINQEIIAKLSPDSLLPKEADYIAKTLQIHEKIQRLVGEKLHEGGIKKALTELEAEYEPEHLISGALVALTDDIGKGEPANKDEDFDQNRVAVEKLCGNIISKALLSF
ncbi:hypothetical protein KKB40_05440, partial [Patescibacteria group bacterium]|nr:hypothetical protein [Patescibacteria group bacterium]